MGSEMKQFKIINMKPPCISILKHNIMIISYMEVTSYN